MLMAFDFSFISIPSRRLYVTEEDEQTMLNEILDLDSHTPDYVKELGGFSSSAMLVTGPYPWFDPCLQE